MSLPLLLSLTGSLLVKLWITEGQAPPRAAPGSWLAGLKRRGIVVLAVSEMGQGEDEVSVVLALAQASSHSSSRPWLWEGCSPPGLHDVQ